MRNLTLNLLCTLAIPAAVAVAQPCTSAPGLVPTFDAVQPVACCPQFTWTAEASAKKYIIYRSLTFNVSDAVVVGTTSGLRFDDYGFPASLYGRNLFYFIRGVNACGEGIGRRAGQIVVQRGPQTSWGYTRAECNRVVVDWSSVSASPGVAISYTLWRTLAPDGAPVRLAEGLTSTDFVDIDPPRGWLTYSVTARSPLCEGPAFPLPAVYSGDPLAPPLLTVTGSVGCGTATLSFSQGPCSDSYSIFRAPANQPDAIVELDRGSFSRYYDHVPDRSIEYSYSVVAHTRFGDSAPSAWQTTSIGNNPPQLLPVDPSFNPFDCTYVSASFEAPMDFNNDLMTFQWYKDGEPLTDGGNIWGAQGFRLEISPALEADNGAYTVLVTNDCGSALSDPFNFRSAEPCPCPPCLPDFNRDGGVDGGDVQAYFYSWEASDFCADANLDGGVDGQDLADWFDCWERCDC